ncbi:MAG: hypothetical protein ACFFBD_09965 [Candidatus Hodarchaeota archaeon]
MAIRNTTRIILCVILIFFALGVINPALGEICVQNHTVKVTLSITNAYYGEAEADGKENDVIVDFTIKTKELQHRSEPLKFGLSLQITHPSGTSYTYDYIVICSRNGFYTPTAYFLNHAIESGYYRIDMTVSLPKSKIATESYVFDPPGGTGGTDPLGCCIE